MSRRGNWMQTYTGRAYWPADPKAEDVCIEDIAHALSMLCRYTGHCKRFYSVAEHSILISQVVPTECAFFGLMHDAQEAYVNDLARPIKPSVPDYSKLEELNWIAICNAFRLPYKLPPIVKTMDMRICLDEQRELMAPPPFPWDADLGEPIGVTICGLPPLEAEELFLRRFHDLYQDHIQRLQVAA